MNKRIERSPFPDHIKAELIAFRVVPKLDLFNPDAAFETPELTTQSPRSREFARKDFEVNSDTITTIEVPWHSPHVKRYHFLGAWQENDPRRIAFFRMDFSKDFKALRIQQLGHFFKLKHFQSEDTSYLFFMKLERAER